MKKLILAVIAIAYLAGFSAASLAGVPGNKVHERMAGMKETNIEGATANKEKMKDDITVTGQAKTEEMNTNSPNHVRQTRLHYSPPGPPTNPIAGMETCGALHG